MRAQIGTEIWAVSCRSLTGACFYQTLLGYSALIAYVSPMRSHIVLFTQYFVLYSSLTNLAPPGDVNKSGKERQVTFELLTEVLCNPFENRAVSYRARTVSGSTTKTSSKESNPSELILRFRHCRTRVSSIMLARGGGKRSLQQLRDRYALGS